MSEFDTLKAGLDQTRQQFLQLVEDLRPQLHRFCTRMSGSALDGEDLVQETLAQAYFKLSLLEQSASLRAWIFSIAHRKCLDFLRSRKAQPEVQEEVEVAVMPRDAVESDEVSFKHVVRLADEEAKVRLQSQPFFDKFVDEVDARCDEEPEATPLTLVASTRD